MIPRTVRFGLPVVLVGLVSSMHAGDLNPPGAPAPTLIAGLPVATPITSVPITIDEPGVYYLADHFTVASTSDHAIVVRADDVVIDLAGLSLTGPDTGTGRGVSAEASVRTTVRNGTIRAFGERGVELGERGLAEDLRISDCPIGLSIGNGGCARRVHANGCDQIGIDILNGCELIDCSVADCGSGIGALYASAITRCSVRLGTVDGITVLGPVVVSDCSVVGTNGAAFRGVLGTVFESCVATGCGVGFTCQGGATIRDCTARLCNTEGIAVEGATGSALIADCHVQGAPIGIRVDLPSTVVRNYVNDASTDAIRIGATDVTVMDNVLMGSTIDIHHTGTGDNCFYARNTYTSGVTLGVNATWGPLVTGANSLADDLNGDNPWANIRH